MVGVKEKKEREGGCLALSFTAVVEKLKVTFIT